jgi:hypothetical protein
MTKVDLKVLVQGYYLENGLMRSVAYNQDDTQPTNEVETVTVKLHDSTGVVETSTGMLHTNGTLSVEFSSQGDYFMSVRGKNSLQLFAPNEFTFNGVDVDYDFTTQADNQVEVESGVFALYSGDINGDGVIDAADEALLSDAITASLYGVQVTDLNGDGNVDNVDTDCFFANLGKTIIGTRPTDR